MQAALCGAKFYPLHDRKNPPNATLNVYQTSDDNWFLIVMTPDRWPAFAAGLGRPELVADPRFVDPAQRAMNASQLTAILDEVFRSQPMAHWHDTLNEAHVTFGVVREPSQVVDDPQLRPNDIVVPLEGAGEKLKFTISSPLRVHDVAKEPARRAPEIGEHNDELLAELGFSAHDILALRASGALGSEKTATVSAVA